MRKCLACGCEGNGNFCPDCGKPMAELCRHCQQPIDVADRFCSRCGKPVLREDDSRTGGRTISFGDVGVMKGSIDASTHTTIGQQTTFHGPVHMNMVPKEPDAAEWMTRGKTALQSKLYTQAMDAFRQAASRSPALADAHYYLALATLQGNRPRLVSLSTIRVVESHLQNATRTNPLCHHAFLLWAIVKEDYYVMNRIHESPPTVAQLLKSAGSVEKSYLSEITTHMSAPSNRIWQWAATQ